jgi:hypothetical protein
MAVVTKGCDGYGIVVMCVVYDDLYDCREASGGGTLVYSR